MVTSFPSARFIRTIKRVALGCPLLMVIFGIIFSIYVISKHPDFHQNKQSAKYRGNRHRGPVTLQEWVEQTVICDQIPANISLEFSTDINSTNALCDKFVILPDQTKQVLNRSLIEVCINLKNAQAMYFRPQILKVNPYIHMFTIPGADICDSNTEMIVLIHSLHTYYDRRKAIRDTWGGAIKNGYWPDKDNKGKYSMVLSRIKLAFVFGQHKNKTVEKSLLMESRKFNDIIQGDFYEHYHNMTLKSLLGLKWVGSYCSHVKYLVKSDDDMIINFPYLREILSNMTSNMIWSVMGPYNVGSKALKRGKWSIPNEKYPFYYYPPYESGSAYIISGDLVKPLFNLSEYVPPIFIDDVYITGILGKILNVTHRTHPGFAYWISKRPKVCDLVQNRIITGTKMRPSDLWKIWDQLVKNPYC